MSPGVFISRLQAWLFAFPMFDPARGGPSEYAVPPELPSELPPPSAELTLTAVILRSHLRTLKRKARRRYLRTLLAVLEEFDTDANVIRLRGREHDAAVARTRMEASAWLRATLAAFFVADSERL